jgi:hypothetical protein
VSKTGRSRKDSTFNLALLGAYFLMESERSTAMTGSKYAVCRSTFMFGIMV